MGLLDALFDPSTYSNQTGGLLARLQPMLGQIQQSAGFEQQNNPISIGGYQMPRVGNPDQFQPQQAMTPPNAQPAQGQMQQPQFESPGGFGAGLRGFANNLHNGPVGAIVGGIGSALGVQDQSQVNQTKLFEAYKAAGLSPAQAYIATLQPNTASNLLGGGQTNKIKEYQYAKQQGFKGSFQDWIANERAGAGEYSLTPQYGTNDKGETVLIQTGKSGEAIQTKLPAGVKISSGIEKVDLGTHWALYDKKSGVSLGTQPKNLAGKEAEEERGKAAGQAQAKIPAALIDAEETTKKIDELLKNEGLNSIVGSVDQFRPSWTLGEGGRKALSQLEQLQGGAFLQAFNTLKGGGAITEIEGQKAERAIARMQRYQSESDFRDALMDFRDAVKTGVRKLQAAASAGGTTTAPAPAPQRIRLNPDGTIAK